MDFNAKVNQLYSKDSSTFEGISIESSASQLGFHQILTNLHIYSKSHLRVLT